MKKCLIMLLLSCSISTIASEAKCLQIDTDQAIIGDSCLSEKGYQFKKVLRRGLGDAWMDVTSGRVYGDIIKNNSYGADINTFCRLINADYFAPEEFSLMESVERGLVEVLANKSTPFWLNKSWQSSGGVCPQSQYAYYYKSNDSLNTFTSCSYHLKSIRCSSF